MSLQINRRPGPEQFGQSPEEQDDPIPESRKLGIKGKVGLSLAAIATVVAGYTYSHKGESTGGPDEIPRVPGISTPNKGPNVSAPREIPANIDYFQNQVKEKEPLRQALADFF